MFRIKPTINYALLIKIQANQKSFAPAVSRKANLKKNSSNKVKRIKAEAYRRYK